jgi:hypothetical protein
MTQKILAPISVGELWDKITILQIKIEQYTNPVKRQYVDLELAELLKIATSLEAPVGGDVVEELKELKYVNQTIWNNEDLARNYGNGNDQWEYDENFMGIAAVTYAANTRRAQIKQSINAKYNSYIIETKSYT